MDVYLNYGSKTIPKISGKKFEWFFERRLEVGTEGKIILPGKIQGAVVIDFENAGFGNITQFKIPTWSELPQEQVQHKRR